MPRRLLRDGQSVDDDWSYAAEVTDPALAGSIILPLERWLTEAGLWAAHEGRLGVMFEPAEAVERIAADVSRFALIAAHFPAVGEGRGYTQGRLLRERYGFTGELRATGYVRRDQLFFLARCGFNSFELPESEMDAAGAALRTFSAAYQPSNDAGLPVALKRRASPPTEAR
jgi:uncharacterized protein (DUF934 family)